MTLNEFIDKLVFIKESYNAGDFSVKVPYYFDMEIQGSFTPWEDNADITDDEICLNTDDKTLYICDKNEIKKPYWNG